MPTSCKCFARCEADCVCDYDWTPPEVTRLRHDIERHIAIASELATENERLRTTIERLRGYARHTPGCYWWSGTINQPHPCDCGYDELMKEMEEGK